MAYWTMPCRTQAERDARAKAKAEYEKAHPLTGDGPRKVNGGFVSASGVFHPARTTLERRVAQWLAQVNHFPVPDCLTVAEEDGKPVFVGRSGKRYPCWLIRPRSLAISLNFAADEEERELRNADFQSTNPPDKE